MDNKFCENLHDYLFLLQSSTHEQRILVKHAGKVLDAEENPVMNNCGYSFLGPVFNVSVHSDNPTIYQGELADLLCIVTTEGMALEPGILAKLISLTHLTSAGRIIPAVTTL